MIRKISRSVQGAWMADGAKKELSDLAKKAGVSASSLAADILENAVKRMTRKERLINEDKPTRTAKGDTSKS